MTARGIAQVQARKTLRKKLARCLRLRRQGLSYDEIANALTMSKLSVSRCCNERMPPRVYKRCLKLAKSLQSGGQMKRFLDGYNALANEWARVMWGKPYREEAE